MAPGDDVGHNRTNRKPAMTVAILTHDWVPNGLRGHERDIRLRRAREEAGLRSSVATVRVMFAVRNTLRAGPLRSCLSCRLAI
jgi:hypothetical protein